MDQLVPRLVGADNFNLIYKKLTTLCKNNINCKDKFKLNIFLYVLINNETYAEINKLN